MGKPLIQNLKRIGLHLEMAFLHFVYFLHFMSQLGLSVVTCDRTYRDSKHTCNEYDRGPWFPATATGQSSSHAFCKWPMGGTCANTGAVPIYRAR